MRNEKEDNRAVNSTIGTSKSLSEKATPTFSPSSSLGKVDRLIALSNAFKTIPLSPKSRVSTPKLWEKVDRGIDEEEITIISDNDSGDEPECFFTPKNTEALETQRFSEGQPATPKMIKDINYNELLLASISSIEREENPARALSNLQPLEQFFTPTGNKENRPQNGSDASRKSSRVRKAKRNFGEINGDQEIPLKIERKKKKVDDLNETPKSKSQRKKVEELEMSFEKSRQDGEGMKEVAITEEKDDVEEIPSIGALIDFLGGKKEEEKVESDDDEKILEEKPITRHKKPQLLELISQIENQSDRCFCDTEHKPGFSEPLWKLKINDQHLHRLILPIVADGFRECFECKKKYSIKSKSFSKKGWKHMERLHCTAITQLLHQHTNKIKEDPIEAMKKKRNQTILQSLLDGSITLNELDHLDYKDAFLIAMPELGLLPSVEEFEEKLKKRGKNTENIKEKSAIDQVLKDWLVKDESLKAQEPTFDKILVFYRNVKEKMGLI